MYILVIMFPPPPPPPEILVATYQTDSRDSVVDIAVLYRADAWGSNSGGGKIFRAHPNLPQGPIILYCNRYRVSFPGVKLLGRGVDH
jgi:hypothetical protein